MALAKFHKQCGKNITGNMHLFLTEAVNVASVVVASGEVTSIVMDGVTTFKEIQCDQNSLQRLIAGARANGSYVNYEHTVSFACSRPSVEMNALSDALSDASPCGLIAIVMDSNGQGWLVGWSQSETNKRPLYPQANNFDSGTGPATEQADHKYSLTGMNDEIDLPMNDIINDYITDSIAAGDDLGFVP